MQLRQHQLVGAIVFLVCLFVQRPPSQVKCSSSAANIPPTVEVDALLQFKAYLSAPSQALLSSWRWRANNTHNICHEQYSWVGITCHNISHQIEAINLTRCGLVGSIGPHLGNLSALTYLDLAYNSFAGSIPSQLSGCMFLRTLNLAVNNLTGCIPPSLASLTSLRFLALTHNDLRGHIPSSLFTNCTSLKVLDMSHNFLTGEIPSDIPSSLTILALYINNLTGGIPSSLGNCTKLLTLDLAENQLTNQIPSELGYLSRLYALHLSYNNLIGAIPASLCNLTSLISFQLTHTALTGPIPPNFGLLSKLQNLQLYVNRLSGSIPESLVNCSELSSIEMQVNRLSGPIPTGIGSLINLQALRLFSNNLTGALPSSIGNCTRLTDLELSYNRFTGLIPKEVAQLGLLKILVLSSNHLSGRLALLGSGNLTSLYFLELYSNRLTGSLPTELGQLQQLQVLDLNGNGFSGEIPWESLFNCSDLYGIDMSDNLLTGTIPSSFARLPVLQVLDLYLNLLHGVIVVREEASGSPSLLELRLFYNKLEGPLPSGLAQMVRTILNLDLSHNNFSGSVPQWLGQLVVAQYMDLSSNNFVGTIPEELRQCAGLELLNLSFNRLMGGIPVGVSKLAYLQTLDVSSNNLTGALPSFLSSLHSLAFLNVSFNNFTGDIPVSGVFKHLNSSSFQGNPGLCGSIIHKECSETHRPPSPSHRHVNRKLLLITTVTLLTAVLIIVAGLVAHFHYRTQVFRGENFVASEIRRYTAEELALATGGYAENNLLGQGAHAAVYRGVLSDGTIVAVKKFKEPCPREFLLKETQILSKLRHRNLVRVRGCVLNLDASALVLDYMPNGSLEHFLHGRDHGNYEWRRLTTIATGLANALMYLHHEYGVPVIHGDIKTSNILLDSNLEAHLADFGLSKLGKEGAFSISSNFKGTIGYMAPEYAYAAQATTKVDVYSFGVVILEMFTGQKPTEVTGGVSLHEWVILKLSDGSGRSVQEALDTRLVVSSSKVGQVLQLFQMGIACTRDQPHDRPTMQEISSFLCSRQWE